MAELHPPAVPRPGVFDRATDRACAGCGGTELVPFLELSDMPVFNNVLWPDRASALRAPTGDIRLVVCTSCGLISNSRFEPDKVEYSAAYENSLHGSTTFVAWARSLAERLSVVHALEGGHVLEVGAGSGEFLAMVCEAAGCTGVGFDPSHDAHDSRTDRRATHVSAVALPHELQAAADLVICRHVLEHVEDPVDLLRRIAVSVRPRRRGRRVPVYLEVPDAGYMLAEDAFWDVIYEHPLYFDLETLRGTLGAAGFETTRWGRTFGNQFAWVEGYTDGGRGRAPMEGRALASRLGTAEGFGHRFRERIDRHQERLESARAAGSVVVWGAGSKGVTFCNLVPAAADALVVDVSGRKCGRRLPRTGQSVHPPTVLPGADVSLVVAMNHMYIEEIRADLASAGIHAPIIVA